VTVPFHEGNRRRVERWSSGLFQSALQSKSLLPWSGPEVSWEIRFWSWAFLPLGLNVDEASHHCESSRDRTSGWGVVWSTANPAGPTCNGEPTGCQALSWRFQLHTFLSFRTTCVCWGLYASSAHPGTTLSCASPASHLVADG
jgi:hypothetical protein